jgi:N utilization substance protein B
MAIRSRRKAREVALRVLYEVEIAKISADSALTEAVAEVNLSPELAAFAGILVHGVLAHLSEIDIHLAHLIKDFAYDRVAPVDRNVMRMAAFELYHLPAIPPAVTLNEAVDIAKKYSTAESGKFVNGVLGQLLLITPKVSWDPALAPAEAEFEEAAEPEPPMEVEEVEVSEEQAKKLTKVGGWTVRSEEPS